MPVVGGRFNTKVNDIDLVAVSVRTFSSVLTTLSNDANMKLNTLLTDINGRPVNLDEHTDAIMAASILTKQPATMPYRIVLRLINVSDHVEWVVHTQLFTNYTIGENGLELGEPSYDTGDYFQFEEMVEAYQRWVKRSSESANHIGSIFRQQIEDHVYQTP